MRGKLNIFQRSMLHWRELSPYNAVHVVKISQPLELPRLQEAIKSQLEHYGLTGLVLDDKHQRFEYKGGPAIVEMKLLNGEQDPISSVSREIEAQINTPFTQDEAFRFFVVEEERAFFLGLVYDHFIAGGESILYLLKGMVDRYACGRGAEADPPPSLYPGTHRRLFLRYPKQTFQGILAIPTMIAKARSSFRPRYSRSQDCQNAFTFFRLESPQFRALRRAGKEWGVTVNDIFLALLLRALAPIASGRSAASRRRNLAVASIINIRKDLQWDARGTFGQFLGSFFISHAVPSEISLRQLTEDVHRETSRIKTQKLYLQALVGMSVLNLLWPLLSEERRSRFYQKHYPLWGGVTTFNVNTLWEEGGHALPADYLRAASTGPGSPLIFVITTVGEVVNVGVAFRTAAFSRATVDRIVDEFAHGLAGLDGGDVR